ncbi:MAG: hypothetical protein Q4C50_01455 [Eubacteriales bacterium]|nr:hypothetical protein [Eubacteriales bacterium]
MRKRIILCMCGLLCLTGLAGCGEQTSQKAQAGAQPETRTEEAANSSKESADSGTAGERVQSWTPPKGSHTDQNGNVVDPEGNTFNKKDGGWEVPVGGHVDASGRIYDKNGNLMGGGAKIGSKG